MPPFCWDLMIHSSPSFSLCEFPLLLRSSQTCRLPLPRSTTSSHFAVLKFGHLINAGFSAVLMIGQILLTSSCLRHSLSTRPSKGARSGDFALVRRMWRVCGLRKASNTPSRQPKCGRVVPTTTSFDVGFDTADCLPPHPL